MPLGRIGDISKADFLILLLNKDLEDKVVLGEVGIVMSEEMN